MTVLMGVLARCLYAIGDIALYRGVLGYEFSESALRKVCGGLFLAGFAGAMAVLPGVEYIEWVMYGMLWLGMMLIFKKLQFGLVVFVFFARMTITNLVDGISIIIFADNDLGEFLAWKSMEVYCVLVQLGFLFLLAILCCKKRKWSWQESVKKTKGWKFIIGATFMMMPTILSWAWALLSNPFNVQNYIFIESNLLSMAIVALVISVFVLMDKHDKMVEQLALNDRCIREQTEQYRILNEKQKELRAFRHDIKGHILAMRRMAAQGSSQELTAYLEKWAGLQEETFYISSNNIIGDAIFNFYYDKGCREGIEVKVVGKFLQDMDVAEIDLCTVLTNTVSNAYEAALKCGKGSIVTIELSQFCGKTMIVITNPVKEEPKIQGGIMSTTKADKELHGLGISNTMKALEKYDGQITWEKKRDEIVTKIVM